MPGPQQILKVIFDGIYVKTLPEKSGSVEAHIKGKVHNTTFPIGAEKLVAKAVKGETIVLPEAKWAFEVDVSALDAFDVSFAVTEHRTIRSDVDLGGATRTLRYPFTMGAFVLENQYFRINCRAQPKVRGEVTAKRWEAFLVRQVGQAVLATSVGGQDIRYRFEICPVIPALDDDQMALRKRLTILSNSLTTRPVYNGFGPGRIAPDAPINVIPNPSVIPIIPAEQAGRNNAARIEVTYYVQEPGVLLDDDDKRLKWTAVSVDGGEACFVGGGDDATGYGLKVYLRGKSEGEVRLELRYKPVESEQFVLVATYRALVKPIRYIPYRATILYSTRSFDGVRVPQSLPAHVEKHVAVANRILRQAGVELAADPDRTATDGAVATVKPGIFELDIGEKFGLIHNVPEGVVNGIAVGHPPAGEMNAKPNVLNLVYVHTFDNLGTKGVATDFPDSTQGGETFTESGSPSSSWQAPSGVWPDADAGDCTLNFLRGNQRRGGLIVVMISNIACWYNRDPLGTIQAPLPLSQDAALLNSTPHLKSATTHRDFLRAAATGKFEKKSGASFPTPVYHPEWAADEGRWREARREIDQPKGKAANQATGPDGEVGIQHFGQCIAHEVGHVLNLRHRFNGEGRDGVEFPPGRNLMGYGSPLEQIDIDIAQAKLIHKSAVLKDQPP
jgi:hypothetical protein